MKLPRKIKKKIKKHVAKVFPELVVSYPEYGKTKLIRVTITGKDRGTFGVVWKVPDPKAVVSAWIKII